jgi:hypothetical protein
MGEMEVICKGPPLLKEKRPGPLNGEKRWETGSIRHQRFKEFQGVLRTHELILVRRFVEVFDEGCFGMKL